MRAAQARNPLQIPERYDGTVIDSRVTYSLRAQTGLTEFIPGLKTPTLGINRSYLDPTLILKRGDDVELNVHNSLAEKTTLHWHGLHVPANADGGPAQIIEPGGSWSPRFTVDQVAGTFWYHSHLLHKTGEQVYHGLTGMIIFTRRVYGSAFSP